MSRGVLLFGLLVVVALAVAGLITGAIGAGFVQDPAAKEAGETAEGPFIPKPAVHLPPQVVAPGGAHDHYIEFLHAEHYEREYGEEKLDEHEKAVFEEGPYKGFNFIITNTLLSCWIASIVLIAIFVIGARRAQMVPGRFQNFCEIVIEALLRFVEGTVGPGRSRLLFPVIATIFLFVLINAWIGLLPIYPAWVPWWTAKSKSTCYARREPTSICRWPWRWCPSYSSSSSESRCWASATSASSSGWAVCRGA